MESKSSLVKYTDMRCRSILQPTVHGANKQMSLELHDVQLDKCPPICTRAKSSKMIR